MKESFHIADLIAKEIKGEITSAEQKELGLWVDENPENLALYKRATDKKTQLEKLEIYSLFRKEKVWSALEDELFETKTIKFTPRKLLRYAAAIFIPLLVAGGAALLFLRDPAPMTVAEIDTIFQPGSQKAILILSDGGTMELDKDKSLNGISDGDAQIDNENSRLKYTSKKDNRTRRIIYNELKTPRGGGYNVQLADGTSVWMNAGSSLRFPVSFNDTIRKVFLEGEAYFEVSHTGTPFIVTAENMDIRVLGTSFNVSAYSDEQDMKTTLVEGLVRIEIAGEDGATSYSNLLLPNKQATLNKGSAEVEISDVNTSIYTSWMKGKMEFDNEPLDIVMRRLARWYDFSYEFENIEAMDYHFTARLDKEVSISSILEMLEMTTDVKFELRDQLIVVL